MIKAVIPAFNDFHSIHKFHVLLFVLDLGHDHCSRRSVKLEEKKSLYITLNQFLYFFSDSKGMQF